MSAYVATLVHNDLVRGIQAPLSISPWEVPLYAAPCKSAKPPSPRGVVVPGFDLD